MRYRQNDVCVDALLPAHDDRSIGNSAIGIANIRKVINFLNKALIQYTLWANTITRVVVYGLHLKV